MIETGPRNGWMVWRNIFSACCAALVCTLLGFEASRAEVVVYRETCDHNAFEDWNLKRTIDTNTFNTASMTEFGTRSFREIQSITICASFHNRGGLNSPAIIVHNYRDGSQSMPTQRFDTGKVQGTLVANKMSWVGTGPRGLTPGWTMQGELRTVRGSFT